MNRTERRTRTFHFTTGAKAVSVMFAVGILMLLIARTPMHTAEEGMALLAVANQPSNAGIGALASTQPRQPDDTAAGAATQATDADAKVPAQPVYLPSRLKSQAPAPVPIYLQSEFKADAPTAEPIPTF